MLKHYDLNKTYLENIYDYTDSEIVSDLSSGDQTLSFTVRGKSDIQCEEYIQTEDQRFIVKEVSPGKGGTEIVCQLDLEPLEGSVFEVFTAANQTVTQAANLALSGTSWRVSTTITKTRSIRCLKKTPLEILYLIRDAFMCELRFDALRKIVYFEEQIGSDRGVYFRKDLNLKDVSVRTDSYDYCTRIIPIGKDDLRIDNDGKEYVENYQYSNKIRTIIWEDTSYEDAAKLMEDAQAKLVDLSKPKRSYSADIRDLARLSSDYDILSYGLGDTVWIIDESKGVKDKQRIVKITEYPQDPDKNKCELSNTTLTWEEMQAKLEAAANAWNDVTNADGTVNGVYVYGISDGNKVIIQTEVNNNPTVRANTAGVAANATAINGVSQDLSAVSARVNTIESDYITTTQLDAVSARIGTIEASYITATEVQANYASIDFANIDTANINTAKVMNLFTQVGLIRDAVISGARITGYLDAVKINAASIDAGTLSVDRLVIRGDNTSLVYAINNISGALQSQNVNTINGEVLTDRTILADKIVAHSITANEIAANTITANEITTQNIVGANGWINLAAGTFNYGAGALVWNGSVLTVNGNVTSTSGQIGGWTIGSDSLYSGSTSGTNAQITLKSGDSGYIRVQNDTAGLTELNNAGFLHQTSSGQINIAGGALTIADRSHYYPSYMLSISSRSISYTETTGGGLKFFIDGTTGAITASSISEGGTTLAQKYMGMETDANNFWGLKPNGSNSAWIRTTSNGLIPYQSGGASSLGTSSWPFSTIYGNTIYEGGTALSSKYAPVHTHPYLSTSGGTLSGTLACKTTDGTSNRYVICSGDDTHRIGRIWLNSTTKLYIHGCANSTTYATYSAEVSASDIRLKTNIDDVEVERALAVIDRIRLHAFDWKDTGVHQRIGVIADELEALDPMLADGGGTDESGNMLVKTVNTFYLQGYMLKAIQELHEEIRALQGHLDAIQYN